MAICEIVILPLDAALAKQIAKNWLEDQDIANVLDTVKAKTAPNFSIPLLY